MSLSVNINYKSNIKEIVGRYNSLSFLEIKNISKEKFHKWVINNGDKKEGINQLQVMVIGKTGYGKSTTLNSIVGTNVFETDDIEACTKDLHCADYRIHDNYFLSFADLPGIGESIASDEKYGEWYREMLKKSCCVVYVLRADQRDFTVDEIFFKSIFRSSEDRDKVIIGLNYADKIEPINRIHKLSIHQISNLYKKRMYISDIFNVDKEKIVWYSAKENINIKILVEKVSKCLSEVL